MHNRHTAIKLGAKYCTQRFGIDWLARALRHNELADLVVRQTKASRPLDDLAFFGSGRAGRQDARARRPAVRSLVPLRDGSLTLGSFFELDLLKK